jgi:hypothetical protein
MTIEQQLEAYKAAFELLESDEAFVGCDHVDHSPFEKEPCGSSCVDKEHRPSLCLLMNDTFYYASGDGEDVPMDEWTLVRDIYKKIGTNGLIAWAARRRMMPPLHEIADTEKYKNAVARLNELFPLSPEEIIRQDMCKGD